MGSKSVRLDERVYEKVAARKHEDETFSEAIDRLIGGPSLLELAGLLSDEEAATFRETIEDVDATVTADVDNIFEGRPREE